MFISIPRDHTHARGRRRASVLTTFSAVAAIAIGCGGGYVATPAFAVIPTQSMTATVHDDDPSVPVRGSVPAPAAGAPSTGIKAPTVIPHPAATPAPSGAASVPASATPTLASSTDAAAPSTRAILEFFWPGESTYPTGAEADDFALRVYDAAVKYTRAMSYLPSSPITPPTLTWLASQAGQIAMRAFLNKNSVNTAVKNMILGTYGREFQLMPRGVTSKAGGGGEQTPSGSTNRTNEPTLAWTGGYKVVYPDRDLRTGTVTWGPGVVTSGGVNGTITVVDPGGASVTYFYGSTSGWSGPSTSPGPSGPSGGNSGLGSTGGGGRPIPHIDEDAQ
jgi:hypothetical protein